MTLLPSLSASLHGALLLGRGKAHGVLLMQADARGVARSFWAIFFALPSVAYIATTEFPSDMHRPAAFLFLIRHLTVFVVAWLGFAVFSHRLAGRIGRGPLWPRMIVAWNWCGVPENMLVFLGVLPGALGAPHIVDQVAQVATFGWAIWIEWFVFRLTFGAGPLLAVWLVMVDQSIGVLVTLLSAQLAGAS
jgi:hypothetical protein